jgi:preprotein translocase subunit SecE
MTLKENRLVKYVSESIVELKKVAWPSRQETISHTLVVIGVSIGMAAFLAAADFGLNKLLEIVVAR